MSFYRPIKINVKETKAAKIEKRRRKNILSYRQINGRLMMYEQINFKKKNIFLITNQK